MNSLKKLAGLLLVAFFLSGCSSTQLLSLKNENGQLKKTIVALQNRIQTSESNKYVTINYQAYPFKQRFVTKESRILALPKEGSLEFRTVGASTVVEVVDAAEAGGKLWLYVVIPVYDSPSNLKGWMPESDTEPFTMENQKEVLGDIFVKAGVKIYNTAQFDQIATTAPDTTTAEQRGRIEEKRDGFARISGPGGMLYWVAEDQITYPIPLTDETPAEYFPEPQLEIKGLQDPVHALTGDLLKHPELIPYKGVLGGKMAFHESGITVLNSRWVLADFDDGHIMGSMILRYKVSKSGKISWKVVSSFLI